MLRAPIIVLVSLGAGLAAMGAGCGSAVSADPVTITGTTTVPATTVAPTAVDQPCGYCTIDGRVLPDCVP